MRSSQVLTKLQDAGTFPRTIRQFLRSGIILKAKSKVISLFAYLKNVKSQNTISMRSSN